MHPILYNIILSLHIVCGATVLITGLLQVILRKGGLWHRRTGRLYFAAMTGVVASGIPIGGLVISIIGIFGYYYCFTGFRLARLQGRFPMQADKATVLLGALLNLGMILMTVKIYLAGQTDFSIILGVFSGIFLTAIIPDIRKYLLPPKDKARLAAIRKRWATEHYVRMYISYIMALTAFSSINNVFGHNLLNWLMPTLIGTIGITASRFYFAGKVG